MNSGELCSPRAYVRRNFQEIGRLMAEGRAVTMAVASLDGLENPLKVQQLVEALLKEQPQDSPEELVTWVAMRRIAGLEITPWEKPVYGNIFCLISWVWVSWAAGIDVGAELKILDFAEAESELGVFETLALRHWAAAILNLIDGNQDEARRFYRRAVEIGGQFGTESNPAVLWTYAATFFDPRIKS